MSYPFLKKETFGLRTQETFIGSKLDIYLPAYYINRNDPTSIAVELGERIETTGIFWFKVNDKDWYDVQLPLKIQFQFSERSKIKTHIQPGMPEVEYFVFTLHNGDAFVYDILHQKSADDVKDFINKMVEGAKLPNTIPYNKVYDIFLRLLEATGSHLGLSSVSLEFMFSELYRSKKNMKEPYRLSYTPRQPYDYKMVRITKLPQLNNTFNSLIGEDIENQLVSSVLRKREGAAEKESPVERIIKY